MSEHSTHSQKLMDSVYRNQRYIYDRTRRYFLLGRITMQRGLNAAPGDRILEIGCGTAWNLIHTASLYPKCDLYGVDISSEMLAQASVSLERHGLASKVHLAQADASRFSAQELFGIEKFERVFISYALSMIPPWRASIEQAIKCLAPGGSLHIVDFGQCERLPNACKRLLYAWLARFHVEPRADLETVLAELAAEHQLELSFERLMRGYVDYAVLTHSTTN